ncbi:MAG: hypothetical protein AAGA99_08150 [Actinomycetota bacterium]
METDLMERALSRISVTAPYFALTDLVEVGGGVVEATIPVQVPGELEHGPIAAAQVARHLAILGSCAAALGRDDDAKHHYLATRAHFARMSNAPAIVEGPLRGRAFAAWLDKRTVRATMTLTTRDGQALHHLEVDYAVLAPRMFARLNPVPDGLAGQPGGDATDPVVQVGDGRVIIECGPVAHAMCAGHFPGHPAAPVALVMGELCGAAGRAMLDRLDDVDAYRVEEGHVAATGLAHAGQELRLEAAYVEPVGAGHRVRGTAFADGVSVGEVDVVLSAHRVGATAGHADDFAMAS